MLIKITKTTTTQVPIEKLTAEDIEMLDATILRTVIKELLHRKPSKPSKPVSNTNTHPRAAKAAPRSSSSMLRGLSTSTGNHKGHDIGTKSGLTSKYHYVYWHTASKSYRITYGSKKNYQNQIEAALAIDKILDKRNDTKRPRNRDEFEEVMDAYNDQRSSTPNIAEYIEENI